MRRKNNLRSTWKFEILDEGTIITNWIEFLIGLKPITTFVGLINKLHDCLKWIGKDPDTNTYCILKYYSK